MTLRSDSNVARFLVIGSGPSLARWTFRKACSSEVLGTKTCSSFGKCDETGGDNNVFIHNVQTFSKYMASLAQLVRA